VAPSVQRRKVWLTPTTRVPYSSAAKTRNPLKFAGVPQTRRQISDVSRPKFTILWAHVGQTLLFNKFCSVINMCLSCKDIARQSCAIVPRLAIFGEFLHPEFEASRVQHVSDLHLKFALRPQHEVWQTSNLRRLRLGEEKTKIEEDRRSHRAKYNVLLYSIGRPNGWMDQDGTWHGCRPQPRRLCVRRGPSPLPPKRMEPPPYFRPISIVDKRLDASRCHLVQR